MCSSLAVAGMVTQAPHGVVVLVFLVLLALVVFVPWMAYRRMRSILGLGGELDTGRRRAGEEEDLGPHRVTR